MPTGEHALSDDTLSSVHLVLQRQLRILGFLPSLAKLSSKLCFVTLHL